MDICVQIKLIDWGKKIDKKNDNFLTTRLDKVRIERDFFFISTNV